MQDTYLSSPDPLTHRKGSAALFRSKAPPTPEENYRTFSTIIILIVSTTLGLGVGGSMAL